MARGNSDETAAADTGTANAGEGGVAAAEADSRFIMLNVPTGDPVTKLGNNPLKPDEKLALSAGQHKRVDVIRALAKTGEWERGAIAKHISQLQGSKVAYQIVFQATRGIPNVKKAERQVAEAPAQPAATSEAQPESAEAVAS